MMDRLSPRSVSTIHSLCHLPGVAAQDHLVEPAGDVEARFAGHRESIATGSSLCN
jgi:hypothetical protein